MDKSSGSSDSRDISLGCGPTGGDLGIPPITLNISTTTGGSFSVSVVDAQISVESLKKIIAKKLKVAKDRICLLHRERELQDGTLKENGLMDGSKIILIPNVETGLLAQRPENTVMQALESLNDSQVNDFLSGKTPLNLSMRLGDHMMLIQLQLSTVNPSSPSHNASRSRSSQRNTNHRSAATSTLANANQSGHTNTTNLSLSHQPQSQLQNTTLSAAIPHKIEIETHNVSHPTTPTTLHSESSSSLSTTTVKGQTLNSPPLIPPISSPISINDRELDEFFSNDFENLESIVQSFCYSDLPEDFGVVGSSIDESKSSSCCSTNLNSSSSFTNDALLEQSPIKSLSNLVSSPIKTASLKNIPITNNYGTPSTLTSSTADQSSGCPDPISAKLTSCLCKRLDSNSNNCVMNECQARQDAVVPEIQNERSQPITSTPKRKTAIGGGSGVSSTFLHKTANNVIGKLKHRHHHSHQNQQHGHQNHSSASSLSSTTNVFRKNLSIEKQLQITQDQRTSNECQTLQSVAVASTSTTITANSSVSVTDNATQTTATTIAGDSLNNSSNPIDVDENVSAIPTTDSRTLAEASRNLTQTLRKLSKEVFTSKVDLAEETPRKSGSGAVIESMKNHGKGIYSGTFSGTLNPALQDRYGRPKRDISTVIHILNDLLSATPQYSRGARISFEPPNPNSAKSTKQASSKSRTTTSESCIKCIGKSKLSSTVCAYGECNGHYNHSSSSTCDSSLGHCNCRPAGTTPTDSKSCNCREISATSSSHAGSFSSTSFANTSNSVESSSSSDFSTIDNRSRVCSCSFRGIQAANTSTGSSFDLSSSDSGQTICSKCSVEMENNKTKFKLDQLRLVMQQKKQRREARKLKGAPYGARVVGTTSNAATAGGATSSTATANTISAPMASPSEVSPNHLVEEVDTAA